MNIKSKYQNKTFASTNYASHKNRNKVVTISTPINARIENKPQIDEDTQAPTFAEMFKNGAHIAIAKKIIRNIASKVEVIDNGDGTYKIKTHRSAQACQDIINSGFTQVIFEDITQAIAETLTNWYANDSIFGVVKIGDNKRFKFDTYTNKNGDEKSYYNKLFGVVESVLYDNSNKSATSGSGVIQNYDVLYVSDNGDNQTSATHINPHYVPMCSYDGAINEVLTRRDFADFVKYASGCKILSKTTIKSFMQVLYGCIDGAKLETIADRYNLGIATVKRRKADIKAVYNDWLAHGGKIEVNVKEYNSINSCAFYGNNGIKATNNGYCEDMKKSVIFESHKPTIGALELHKEVSADEKQYASDTIIEYKKTSDGVEVWYTHYIEIDGEKIKKADYIHTISFASK